MAIKTAAEIKADADEKIPDNHRRLTSPMDIRERIKDLADSAAFAAETPSLDADGSVVEEGRSGPADIRSYGSIGQADDGAVLAAAIAGAARRRLFIPPGTQINIPVDRSITLTGDLAIDAHGVTLDVADGATLTILGVSRLGTTLAADIAYGARDITPTDLTGVQVGDPVSLRSQVVAETTRNYVKRFMSRVVAIDGGVATMMDKTLFAFTAAESGQTCTFHAPTALEINGLRLRGHANTSERKVLLSRLSRIRLNGIKMDLDHEARGIAVSRSLDVGIYDTEILAGQYCYEVDEGTRLVRAARAFVNGRTYPLVHFLVPAIFPVDILVEDLSGFGALIESHAGFNVRYRRARILLPDGVAMNLRSVSGGIEECEVGQIGTPSDQLFQTAVTLTDPSPWDDATFTLARNKFDVLEDNAIGVEHGGRITITDNLLPAGAVINVSSGSTGSHSRSVYHARNKGLAGVFCRKGSVPIETEQSEFDAIDLGGDVYEIRAAHLATRTVSGSVNRLVAGGLVFAAKSGSPSTGPYTPTLRIFDDWSQNGRIRASTVLSLTLKAELKYANSIASAETTFDLRRIKTDAADATVLTFGAGVAEIALGAVTAANTGGPGNALYIAVPLTLTGDGNAVAFTLRYRLEMLAVS